jgi:ABC-type sulfate/molybdate transport systems ATPase subunit
LLGKFQMKNGKFLHLENCLYQPENLWIENGTIQENILYGRNLLPTKYEKICEICELKEMMKLLPNGDKTDLSCVNISGGQKSRINLARICYHLEDDSIVLLDDPFTSIDEELRIRIFENVILKFMKNHSVLLVLRDLRFLSYFDQVVMMEDGRIKSQGDYQQIQKEMDINFEFQTPLKKKKSSEFHHCEIKVNPSHDEIRDSKSKSFELFLKFITISGVFDIIPIVFLSILSIYLKQKSIMYLPNSMQTFFIFNILKFILDFIVNSK